MVEGHTAAGYKTEGISGCEYEAVSRAYLYEIAVFLHLVQGYPNICEYKDAVFLFPGKIER